VDDDNFLLQIVINKNTDPKVRQAAEDLIRALTATADSQEPGAIVTVFPQETLGAYIGLKELTQFIRYFEPDATKQQVWARGRNFFTALFDWTVKKPGLLLAFRCTICKKNPDSCRCPEHGWEFRNNWTSQIGGKEGMLTWTIAVDSILQVTPEQINSIHPNTGERLSALIESLKKQR